MNESRLADELTPLLGQFDLELDGVAIRPAGRRTVLRLTVDGDGPRGRGPSVDEIAAAAQAISRHLDSSAAVGQGAYTLEVSSPGVDRPLTRIEHWRRSLDRLVRIELLPDHGIVAAAENRVEGRISGATDTAALIMIADDEIQVPYSVISKALIQVELTKRRAGHDADPEPVEED